VKKLTPTQRCILAYLGSTPGAHVQVFLTGASKGRLRAREGTPDLPVQRIRSAVLNALTSPLLVRQEAKRTERGTLYLLLTITEKGREHLATLQDSPQSTEP
jgi:hypothetical protein